MSAPHALTCEYLDDPLGMDEPGPRFAWRVDAKQSAYQIVVRRGEDVVWDTGEVASDRTAHVAYDGEALRPRTRYTWQVRAWHDAQPSPWSDPAHFETGIDDWRDAQWIGPVDDSPPDEKTWTGCAILRKTFSAAASEHARLYITAKGIYHATLNGQPITDETLAAGFTDFRVRANYRTIDIAPLLVDGENTLDIALANGWYCSDIGMWAGPTYDHRPRLLARLVIDDENEIVTDASWQMTLDGPTREADIFHGETFDARRADLDGATWQSPAAEPRDDLAITAHPAQPVRPIRELKPVALTEPQPGVHIFDLGQNIVGRARLSVDAPAGTTVTLRFGEMLQEDGTLYTENLRKAKATDRYTCAGGGETWEPMLTFHGFRYVEVTGLPSAPSADTITGIVLHNDMPQTGTFTCSHELLNKLQSAIEWGQRGNFLEVPTDCPQRNERQGWTGDAQIFAATACFNMDVAAFFTKWLADMRDAQGPDGGIPRIVPGGDYKPGPAAWSDAATIVPWVMYQRYGDRRIIERCYDMVARFIDHCENNSDNLIRPYEGYGDWLQIETFTPLDLISTAYFAHSTDLARRMADVLNRADDVKRFRDLHARIATAFNNRFVTPDGRVVGDTQTAYILALQFNLLPQDKRAAAAERLVWDIEYGRSMVWPYPERKGHLSTGFVGVRDLPFALSDNGYADVAIKLLLTETYPSWLFPIVNGATTIWERWNSWTPDHGFGDVRMNSFNHYAYGAIGQWMVERLAGLAPNPEHPGYRRAIIRPTPPRDGSITHARVTYESIHGGYACEWRIEGDAFTLDVTVPPNCGATATLPDGSTHELLEGDTRLSCAL